VICCGIEREVTSIDDVDFSVEHVAAIAVLL
jgi:hypothetical protein